MPNTRGFRFNTRGRVDASQLAPVQVRLEPPWAGFIPDIQHHVAGVSAARIWQGFWIYGGSVVTPDGFVHILANAVEPIFGNDDDAAGYTEAGGALFWGTGVTASADQVQPIAVIGWYFSERGATPADQHTEAFVITATTDPISAGGGAGGADGNPEYNHLFVRDIRATTNLWVSKEFISNADVAPSGAVTIDSPPRWTLDEPMDFAIWDLPLPNSGTSQVDRPPLILWCSRRPSLTTSVSQTDASGTVCYYPQDNIAVPINYSNMASYMVELDNAAVAGGDQQNGVDVAFGIGARSLTVFDARAMYLNTSETVAFVRQPRRVRWSAIGNPFMLDQSYSSASNSLVGVGAGFADLDEFAGEGVKIEVLGDVVACYMEDGVAFLRRTGEPLFAFEREIVDRERGLLGTRALAIVGDGLHFGIFNDGWFYLDEAGRWKEAGVMPAAGGGDQPQRLFKWKENFYGDLNREQAFKTTLEYDQTRQLIKIAWPAGATGALTVWTYDISNDRVYPDAWGTGALTAPQVTYTQERAPTCLGSTPADIHGPVSPDAWDNAAGRVLVHGSADGSVYAHDKAILQFDGDNINWQYTIQATDWGLDPFVLKTIDKIWVEYETTGVGAEAATVARIELTSDQSVIGFSDVTLDTAAPGALRVTRFATPVVVVQALRSPGHNHTFTIRGSGTVKIVAIRVQLLVAESRGLGSQVYESGGTDV